MRPFFVVVEFPVCDPLTGVSHEGTKRRSRILPAQPAVLAPAQQAAQDAAVAADVVQSVLATDVLSVGGRTGAVAAGIGDIPDMTAQLVSKAGSSHGNTIAQMGNLKSKLREVEDLTTVVDEIRIWKRAGPVHGASQGAFESHATSM